MSYVFHLAIDSPNHIKVNIRTKSNNLQKIIGSFIGIDSTKK